MIRPELKKAAFALTKIFRKIFAREPFLVTREEAALRVQLCKQCPHYLPNSHQCALCSCFIPAKASLGTETCPADNWPPVKS